MSAPAVELEHVFLRRQGELVLEDVSLRIERCELLAVLGPNGSGKTSLLLVLLGALSPESGTVRVLGRSPREARALVGYVPQHAGFDREFPIRVRDVALMGRLAHRGVARRFSAEDRAAAAAALERMQVGRLADRPIGSLSGGELRRVLIARALAGEPKLLLLDEPTAHLDEPGEANVWELLDELSRELPIVLVSHDVGAVSRRVARVACVNRRLFVHAAADLTPEVLGRVYGAPVLVLAHDHGHHRPPQGGSR